MSKENKDLNELEKKFNEAEEAGKKAQKIGQQLIKASEQGKEIIKDIKSYPESLDDLRVSSWLVQANATIPTFYASATQPLESYLSAVSTSTASAIVVIGDFEWQKQDKKKEYELGGLEKEELDAFLKQFNNDHSGLPDLAKIREGAWQTYYSETGVSLMNASHSMREILRHIISQIAINEEIKKAEWWQSAKDGEGKITSRAKLQYLIFGPKADRSEEMVASAVEASFNAYSRLQSIAHGSASYKEEVKECMQKIEYTLLAIFRHKKLKGY